MVTLKRSYTLILNAHELRLAEAEALDLLRQLQNEFAQTNVITVEQRNLEVKLDQLISMLGSDNPSHIDCIKVIREIGGATINGDNRIGLKEAKDLVEYFVGHLKNTNSGRNYTSLFDNPRVEAVRELFFNRRLYLNTVKNFLND